MLILDETFESSSRAPELLNQSMAHNLVSISCACDNNTIPAKVVLVAAVNPRAACQEIGSD